MATIYIKGTYYHRTGWTDSNWSRMLTAHDTAEPTILDSGLFPGTFNVQIVATGVAGSSTWTGDQTDTWTVPTGVTNIRIHCYGKGGNVSTPADSGGGGGYIGSNHDVTAAWVLDILPGPKVRYKPAGTTLWEVDGGGDPATTGTTGSITVDDSNFTNVIANTGGNAGTPTGDVANNGLGGGGGGAGPVGNGSNGANGSGSTGGAGGASGGGLAGAGGTGANQNADGGNGSNYGGGGGGGISANSVGGDAYILIEYIVWTAATTYTPDNDDTHRQTAHDEGVVRGNLYSDGSDFLYKGNYIHPAIQVIDIAIEGYAEETLTTGSLYYAGSPTSFTTGSPLVPGAITRHSLEIMAEEDIATATGAVTNDVMIVELDDGI